MDDSQIQQQLKPRLKPSEKKKNLNCFESFWVLHQSFLKEIRSLQPKFKQEKWNAVLVLFRWIYVHAHTDVIFFFVYVAFAELSNAVVRQETQKSLES